MLQERHIPGRTYRMLKNAAHAADVVGKLVVTCAKPYIIAQQPTPVFV